MTATRWQRILRGLGHRVAIAEELGERSCDLLVALHARRSAPTVKALRARAPEVPIVVALTGTDLYRDVRGDRAARRSLRLADRLIVLQSNGIRALPAAVRDKARVIHQSSLAAPRSARTARETFDVAVVGHLRAEKDPFRAAHAALLLPAESRVRIVHVGRALTPKMARSARRQQARNPRYRWVGERSPAAVRALLARSDLMVLTSRIEGGANVLSEAIVARTPVLASRIPSSVGVLGSNYPGFFRVGSTSGLARLLSRAERDAHFRRALVNACRARRPLFSAARERSAWRALLLEIPRRATARPRRASPSSAQTRRPSAPTGTYP